MAQNLVPKQQSWVQRFSSAVGNLLNDYNVLTNLCTEFSQETYGSGGANALTDTIVQGVLPAATAAIIDSAEGAITSPVLSTIASNLGYLYPTQP